MSLMWREQLSVGNDVIDNDHRYLIDIINRVEESLVTRNRAGAKEALEKLSKYSQEHFVREEKIAKAAGYEQVPDLNESHTALLAQLDQLRQEINQEGQDWSSDFAQKLTKLMRNWLIDHVIKEDLLMKPALQKLSPLFDPR